MASFSLNSSYNCLQLPSTTNPLCDCDNGHARKHQIAHSLAAALAGAGELELCARIELCRRKGLPAVSGIRSGVLREAPKQRPSPQSTANRD